MNFLQVAHAIKATRDGWDHLENETMAIDDVARAVASELRHYDAHLAACGIPGVFSTVDFLKACGVQS